LLAFAAAAKASKSAKLKRTGTILPFGCSVEEVFFCYSIYAMKAIFLFLALLQTARPIPGETTKQSGKNSEGLQKQASADKATASKAEALKSSIQPNLPGDNRTAQTGNNEQKPVPVRVAPVEVHKDWADYLFIVASLLLTLATFIIALYAAVQAKAAKQSAENDERTVRLTERADVLLEAAGFDHPIAGRFDGHSRISLPFKNFGRTRANNVLLDVNLLIPGVPNTPAAPPIPKITIGAGDTQTVKFGSFLETLTQDTFRGICDGSIKLGFVGEIAYQDVFGTPHIVECSGEFHPRTRSFICTKNNERNPN
jgi:hypothetical protein